jgi:hypothetical protein
LIGQFIAATGEVSSAPNSWTPSSKPADVAFIVTVCQPTLPTDDSPTFKLTLHPRSPSSVFYLHYDPEEFPGILGHQPHQPAPSPHWRHALNKLRPGEEYHALLRNGELFCFGSYVQQEKGQLILADNLEGVPFAAT